MENERKFIVYKHTSPDGKIYIGMTSQPTLEERSGRTGSGYIQNEIFWNAIQKFGWKNFSHEVLFENLPEDYARVLERAFIFIYKSNNPEFGYNTTNGGEKPGMLGKSHSEKSKQLMSEHQIGLHSGEKHPLFGTHPSIETRNKISYGVAEFNKGHHWYNNGIIETFSYECPDGFVQGRLYRTRRKRK